MNYAPNRRASDNASSPPGTSPTRRFSDMLKESSGKNEEINENEEVNKSSNNCIYIYKDSNFYDTIPEAIGPQGHDGSSYDAFVYAKIPEDEQTSEDVDIMNIIEDFSIPHFSSGFLFPLDCLNAPIQGLALMQRMPKQYMVAEDLHGVLGVRGSVTPIYGISLTIKKMYPCSEELKQRLIEMLPNGFSFMLLAKEVQSFTATIEIAGTERTCTFISSDIAFDFITGTGENFLQE